VSNKDMMQQAYNNLPFKNPNEKFKDAIYKDYILKSLDWIERASGGVAFAQNYGSNWEAAYALQYLLDVRKIALQRNENDCVPKIENMCKTIVAFLLAYTNNITDKEKEFLDQSSGQLVEHNDRTNWDSNTWDTSVVCNALLYYIDEIGSGKKSIGTDAPLQRIWIVLPNAIKWLFDQFEINRRAYSQYSFGSVDYSRILTLFIYIIKSNNMNTILRAAKLTKVSVINAIHDLADYIDKVKVEEKVSIYDELNRTINDEMVVNWGDCFITSETCDAVSHYLNFLAKNKQQNNHDEWVERVYSTLKKVMRSIEARQNSEGMWGAHDDTIRCLSSYLSTISELKIFEGTYLSTNGLFKSTSPSWIRESDWEEHKVFKAIRWLFDPKQLFSDGSYLHTSFLSVFMFEAFIAIYNHWDFTENKTLYLIYDEVFWMSPARTTQEKGQVVELEIEQERKLVKIKKLKRRTRVMSLACTVVAMIAAFVFISSIFGLINITVTVDKEDAEGLSLILTLVVLVVSTLGARYFDYKGDD
jgi:hypothetical protein